MNSEDFAIEIFADNQPTVLEKLLQVTRFRGYAVSALDVKTVNNESDLNISLTVNLKACAEPTRENEMQKLFNQLSKLFDIKHVNLIHRRLEKRSLPTNRQQAVY